MEFRFKRQFLIWCKCYWEKQDSDGNLSLVWHQFWEAPVGWWHWFLWIVLFLSESIHQPVATSSLDTTSSCFHLLTSPAPPACQKETGYLGDRTCGKCMKSLPLIQLLDIICNSLCFILKCFRKGGNGFQMEDFYFFRYRVLKNLFFLIFKIII